MLTDDGVLNEASSSPCRSIQVHRCAGSPNSFNDLIGAGEEHRQNGKTKYLGSLQIDDELEFYRLLYGKIVRLGASQDPTGQDANLAKKSEKLAA